jgi:hypothetical protein
MANRVVERGYYEILADPTNISLACEVFSRLSAKRKTGAKSQDAVLVFLHKSENAGLVSTICTQFPSVLIRLVRTVLLTQLVELCKAKLENNVEWQVAPYEIGEQFNAKELYPGIELSPTAFNSRQHWSFYLELEGQKLPMTFCHGITFYEKGGEPKKMSHAVAKELNAFRTRLQERSLDTRLSPSTYWFARSITPYAPHTLGDKPQVTSEIHEGVLATKIASEFITLFEEWSKDVSRLNAALTPPVGKL